jgi:hypothetical protein
MTTFASRRINILRAIVPILVINFLSGCLLYFIYYYVFIELYFFLYLCMNKKIYFVIDLSLFILRINIVCYHGNRTCIHGNITSFQDRQIILILKRNFVFVYICYSLTLVCCEIILTSLSFHK